MTLIQNNWSRNGPRSGSLPGNAARVRGGRGVTLVELLIALSVLVILTTIGIPTFATLIHNNRVAVISNDLTLALTLARAEAIKRAAPVRICASADGVDCDITDPNDCNADWSGGWLVLPADGGAVVRVREAVGGAIGPVEASSAPWVTFDGLGAAALPNCVPTARASFAIGDTAEPRYRQRRVELLASGRVALQTL